MGANRQLATSGELKRLINKHGGALIIRGLPIKTPEDYSEVAHAFGFIAHEEDGISGKRQDSQRRVRSSGTHSQIISGTDISKTTKTVYLASWRIWMDGRRSTQHGSISLPWRILRAVHIDYSASLHLENHRLTCKYRWRDSNNIRFGFSQSLERTSS